MAFAPRRSGRRAGTCLAVALLLAGLAPCRAEAAPRPTAQQLVRRIARLEHRVDIATERYNQAREGILGARTRLLAAEGRVAAQQRRVEQARVGLGLLAADVYRRGDLQGLGLVLGDDPQAMLAQAGLVATLATRRSDLVESLEDAEQRLRDDADLVAAQEQALRQGRRRLAERRRAVLRRLTLAQAELASLSPGQRAWIDRTTRAREERAVRDAMGRPRGAGETPPPPGSVPLSCMGVPVTAPDTRVAGVLAFACEQIGDPYVWGAVGPDSWDCSGLTAGAWARAGVSLPHSARMQRSLGTPVTRREDLRPGDLVFFHSPVSHVGISIGGGLMVHAPRTGQSVKVAALLPHLSGAVRL